MKNDFKKAEKHRLVRSEKQDMQLATRQRTVKLHILSLTEYRTKFCYIFYDFVHSNRDYLNDTNNVGY
jgi:hypothetical protein